MIEWDEDGDMQTLVDEILKILPRRIGDAPLFTTRQGKKVTVVQPPGSISPHLAAQAGLFTVHPHDGSREKPFKVFGLENQFSILPDTPLMKTDDSCTGKCQITLVVCQDWDHRGKYLPWC